MSEHLSEDMILAVVSGNKQRVIELINSGADVNSFDAHGSTPLCCAVRMHKLPIVELLLEHGAQLEISDKEGYTPLLLAAEKGSLAIVRALLKTGANVNTRDRGFNFEVQRLMPWRIPDWVSGIQGAF